jgi:hypothetical protein
MAGSHPRRRQRRADWKERERWIHHSELAFKTSRYIIGNQDLGNQVLLAFVDYEPGALVDAHAHLVDYASVVLRGSIEVTRTLEEVGSIRLVDAGTSYGPLRAGPEGCTVLDIFALGASEEDVVKAQYLRRIGYVNRNPDDTVGGSCGHGNTPRLS